MTDRQGDSRTGTPAPAERLDQVRHALEGQGFTRLLGAVVEEVAPGRVVLSVNRRPELLQQAGLFHGGVVAYLVDNAAAAAAGTHGQMGEGVLTAEFKLNILAPGIGDRLVCTAQTVRPGRTLTVVEARVHDLRDGEPALIAVALATIMKAPADRTKAAVRPAA